MLPTDVIAKLNECAKTDFGSIRDLWFGRLALSTNFVIAGLALEVFELGYETAEFVRDRIRFLRYRVVILERHVQMAKLIAFVGWFLIVGGVAGERFSEARVKNADINIQECSDAKVTAATLDAGDAAKSAKNAYALGTDLLEKYKKADTELTELKAERLPRRLSSAQKASFRKRVGTFTTKTLSIWCTNAGQEGFDFEQDFVDALIHPSEVLALQYLTSCNQIIGSLGGGKLVPIEVSIGADRKRDGITLVDALVGTGVKRSDITITSDKDRARLSLGIGPKYP